VAQPPGGYGSHDATAQRCRGRKAVPPAHRRVAPELGRSRAL